MDLNVYLHMAIARPVRINTIRSVSVQFDLHLHLQLDNCTGICLTPQLDQY